MINYDSFFSHSAEQMKESAIRRMGMVLAQSRDIISFAPGYPATDTFPWHEFTEISRELLSGADGSVLQYGPTRGFKPLLEAIGGIMHSRGVTTAIQNLIVTTGSQQGLDLVARVLLDPGDVVLVELPTYTGAITAFRNVQASMVGVPQEADGIDLGALDETWQRLIRDGRRVRMLYLVPNFQNPTGLLIGLEKRRRLLDWAERRNLLIVEDDPYRELYFEDSATEADVRPIRADDANGRVVYLSSFSKTLAPGYRVAWIEAPAPLVAKFELAKQAAAAESESPVADFPLDATARQGLGIARLGDRDALAACLLHHCAGKRVLAVLLQGRRQLQNVLDRLPRRGLDRDQ